MCIFHLKYQTISRGKKRSATAAASYRTATRIEDARERRRNRRPPVREGMEAEADRWDGGDDGSPRKGKVHDYRRKMGVLKHAIKLPAGAPEKYMDRSTLWNGAEDAEKRCNAVVAREMDVALPHELPFELQWACAEDMADWLINRYGVAVDIAVHKPADGHDQRNTHAHIMFTSRGLTPDGFGNKTRELDAFATREQELRAIRQAWQDIVNARLAAYGLDVRIDCRTLDAQGIDRIPQIHVGVNGVAMDDRNITPVSQQRYDRNGRLIDWADIDAARSRADFNAEIIELNKHREKFGPLPLEVQIKNIERMIAILMEKVTDLESLIPASLLPEWVRAKIEHFRYIAKLMMDLFNRKKEEEEETREKKKQETGIHEQMRRMREQIAELERAKARREAVQRLYTRIEAIVAMRPPMDYTVIKQDNTPPPRVLSIEQYNVELQMKAEAARAKVPPEYRVRVEITDIVWDAPSTPPEESTGLTDHFHTAPPADNGGTVEPPPPVTPSFNEMANPRPEKPYKQKVNIGFGPI